MSIGSSIQGVKWELRELQNEWSYTPPFYVPSRCAQGKIPNKEYRWKFRNELLKLIACKFIYIYF
jgi:hypothetical protein